MTRYVLRYHDGERINHWAVVVLFLAAALSGLALFHPALFFLSALFGGGPWDRILHPFLGVLAAILFGGMFVRFWRANVMDDGDRRWLRHAGAVMRNEPAGEADAGAGTGKYNAGQKIVFWVFSGCLLVLLVTGFLFWRPWFAGAFPVEIRRIGVVLHAIAATLMVVTLIVHVYAAIWVKGSVRAMTRGTVTERWARRHHPRWAASAAAADAPRPADTAGRPPLGR
jgi:formate dehydrogenase subunit gamma